MNRLLLIAALAFSALPGRAQMPEARPFRTLPDEHSPAARVEFTGLQHLKLLQMIYSRDEILDTPLSFALSLDPDSYNPLFEGFARPTPRLAVLLKHSGKSSLAIAAELTIDLRRSDELRELSPRIRALEAAIDLRAGKAKLAAIAESQAHAEALLEERAKLIAELQKLRASRQMYAACAELRAKEKLTDSESRELAALEKTLGPLTTQDAIDFRYYMERMVRLDEGLKAGKEFEWVYTKAKAAYLRSTIPHLRGQALALDRREQSELARLEDRQKTLSAARTLGDLLPKGAEAREAFILEWGILNAAPYAPQFFHAEGEKGEFEIAAWVTRGYRMSVGVDGAGRIKLTGTDTLHIASPDVKAFSRCEADIPAMIRSGRDGNGQIQPTAAQAAPFIAMPVAKKANMVLVDLDLADGVEVDLRELNTKDDVLHAGGAARYLFSDKTNRTNNRLELDRDDPGRAYRPIVISIPSTIKLTAEKDVFLTRRDLLLRLDCVVTAQMDEKAKPSLDIELRAAGKQPLRIAVLRDGKSPFADAKALVERIEAAKKEMIAE